MNKFKSKNSGQLIMFEGKYYGYIDNQLTRGWVDNPFNAIVWKSKLKDISLIYADSEEIRNQLSKATLVKIIKEVNLSIE